MADIVSPGKRSMMMAAIKSKDTLPELRVRKALFAAGYRFRLHRKDLPGRPDIVLPGRKIAIFVHGCFWHSHAGCKLAKIPATRPEFWARKLGQNVQRDQQAKQNLIEHDWRVLIVWECFLRAIKDDNVLSLQLENWIETNGEYGEL